MTLDKVRIGDFGRIVTGKTPSTKTPEMFDGQHQFVTPSDLDWKTYRCTSTERHVSEAARSAFRNQFIPVGSVMVTCIGNTIGKCGLAAEPCLTNQQINSIVPNPDCDPKFLYYLMIHNMEVVRSIGIGGGAATPIVNKTTFSNIMLRVPPRILWPSIGHALSAYDDLIENNRRRIQLLEQAARLLYKEWFVHLRFPGHEHVKVIDGVPEGWARRTLREVAPLSYGKALKKDNRVPGPFPVYGSSGVIGTHEKAMVEGPGIIVGRKGNIGSVFWTAVGFHPIDTVYFIGPDRASLFLYYSLQQMQFINTDVAVPGLNRDFAHSRTMVEPNPGLVKQFDEYASDFHAQMELLQRQNLTLESARDLLLPRLMNGEIAV